jgi:hypothetical protein
MELRSETITRLTRLVAVVALLLGLSDAARLLGVSLGSISPISVMGVPAFILLGVFGSARLFAAVGLWLRASWGAVLLVGATVAELVLLLTGWGPVSVSAFGLGVRILLIASVAALFLLGLRARRARVHD